MKMHFLKKKKKSQDILNPHGMQQLEQSGPIMRSRKQGLLQLIMQGEMNMRQLQEEMTLLAKSPGGNGSDATHTHHHYL